MKCYFRFTFTKTCKLYGQWGLRISPSLNLLSTLLSSFVLFYLLPVIFVFFFFHFLLLCSLFKIIWKHRACEIFSGWVIVIRLEFRLWIPQIWIFPVAGAYRWILEKCLSLSAGKYFWIHVRIILQATFGIRFFFFFRVSDIKNVSNAFLNAISFWATVSFFYK